MTYNIGYLSGMTNNQSVKRPKSLFTNNMKTFLQYLEENPAEVIAFQEIDYDSRRSYYIDQLQTIAVKAGYPYGAKAVNWDKRYVHFPYWPPSVHFGKTISGQAVLSRYPILDTERIVLQKRGDTPFYYNTFYLDRLIQVVKNKIAAHTLVVLNVHLEAWEQKTRENQAKRVLDIYRYYKDKYPVLVVGDFNALPPAALQKKNFADESNSDFTQDKTIEIILSEKSLKTAFPGSTFTFPADKPTRKLDYIFYEHEKMNLLDTRVVYIDSSDHLPLVMQFSFK
jgi:endonuclease/exonuclease/phosphatase family metal-dependent hydrolase